MIVIMVMRTVLALFKIRPFFRYALLDVFVDMPFKRSVENVVFADVEWYGVFIVVCIGSWKDNDAVLI